jgi:O-antigen ligase
LFNDLPYDRAVSGIGLFLALAAGAVLIGSGIVLLRDRDARPLILLALGSLGLAAVIAVLAFMKGADLGRPLNGLVSQSSTDLRAYGPFYNSDYLGFAAAQAIVLAVGWAVYEQRFRLPVLVVAALASIALVASFARSGFLAVAVGIVALAFMRNRRLGLIVLVVGGIAFLLAYETLLKARVEITYGAAPGSALGTLSQSDAGRSNAAVAGVQLFLTAPAFGIGYGQFHYLSPRFVGSSGVTFPHNIFVGILAEQGILGVIVFGALLLAIIVGMRRSGHPLAVPIGSLGITYLFGSLFIDSITTLQTSVLFWICLAAVLSRPRGDRVPLPAGPTTG